MKYFLLTCKSKDRQREHTVPYKSLSWLTGTQPTFLPSVSVNGYVHTCAPFYSM